VKPLRIRLGRIEDELRDVQRHFSSINAVLNLRRDDFTDAVRQNMLAAYEFLDAVIHDGLDLFTDPGLEALLKLNHLVLLGRDYDSRAFGRHISATRERFFANFSQYANPIRRWYRKHETENPYKVAAASLRRCAQPTAALSGREPSYGFPDRERYPAAERLSAVRSHPPECDRVLQPIVRNQVYGQAFNPRQASLAQISAPVQERFQLN